MPIFDYKCRSCGETFETLVRGTTTPSCPLCKSTDLERLLSLPAIKSQTTHALAMRAAKKRDRAQGQAREAAQREYELNHDND